MKAALYSPYLDTFGGGEKYMMTIAEILSKAGQVDVLLDNHLFTKGAQYLKNELSRRFNLDLTKTNFIRAPFGKESNFLSRFFFLKRYDLLFYLTDGSIFFPSSKKNILHIQSPLIGQPAKSLWGRIKLSSWNLILYNSLFTKENSVRNWPLSSYVIYPPVDIAHIKPLQKKKYILSVGRFFGFLKDKKHEIMIRIFIELCRNKKIRDWSLHLAGAASKGDQTYLKELQKIANSYPIIFYPNIDADNLFQLYGQSTIYWHAAGYNETDPTKMEHFGISTVEAMAAGCVPVVIRKGGQLEIVESGKSGFFWNDPEELKEHTINLISSPKLIEKISKQAHKRSINFSKEIFVQKIKQLSQC